MLPSLNRSNNLISRGLSRSVFEIRPFSSRKNNHILPFPILPFVFKAKFLRMHVFRIINNDILSRLDSTIKDNNKNENEWSSCDEILKFINQKRRKFLSPDFLLRTSGRNKLSRSRIVDTVVCGRIVFGLALSLTSALNR